MIGEERHNRIWVHREGKVRGGGEDMIERQRETDRPTNRQTNTERETDTERRGGRYEVTTKRAVRTRDSKKERT